MVYDEPQARPANVSRRVKRLAASALALGVLTVGQGFAQSVPAGVALPPAGSPIERMRPPSAPSVSPGGMTLETLNPSEVPDISIPVRQTGLDGSTLFDAQLRPMLDGLAGPSVSLRRLDEVRREMLAYYRSRGYALTTVSLGVNRANGIVQYHVIEGRIVAARLDGDIGPAGTMVLKFLNRLTEIPVLNNADLERYLLLAQDVPGVTVSTVLEPSKADPGALTIVAQVSLKHVAAQISADNRAFDLTGPNEALGILSLSGFTSWGDKTELSFFHSFPNSQNFGQVTSEWFVGSNGLKVKLYAGAGENVPTGSLAALKYDGWTDIFGAQVSYPLIRSRQQTLVIYSALDAQESHIDTGTPASQASADEIRSLRIGEEWQRADLLLGDTRPATNVVNVRISRGLDVLGGFHGTAQPPATARSNERHNYTAFKFEASRTQTLFVPWDGASVAFMALVTGQWSGDVLPPAEQFYLGGSRFTRGYYAGQAPGDKALAVTGELQLNTTIDLTSFGSHADVAAQFYTFYDWGETWQNQGTDYQTRLASAGGGVRMQITKYAELDLEALGRLVIHPPPATADMNGIGLYWRIVGRY
jgi:hemolysin activation/secretion protein